MDSQARQTSATNIKRYSLRLSLTKRKWKLLSFNLRQFRLGTSQNRSSGSRKKYKPRNGCRSRKRKAIKRKKRGYTGQHFSACEYLFWCSWAAAAQKKSHLHKAIQQLGGCPVKVLYGTLAYTRLRFSAFTACRNYLQKRCVFLLLSTRSSHPMCCRLSSRQSFRQSQTWCPLRSTLLTNNIK